MDTPFIHGRLALADAAELMERFATLLQKFALDVAGRGNDADGIARPESLRFGARRL